MVLIFSAVFGVFAKIPSDGVPYPVFAFTAVLAWTYFSEAFRRCSTGLVEDSELIRKIYFPRLILPFAAVVAPLVDFLISLVVLLAMMLWYGIVPSANIVLVPVFVLLAMLLALAFGLWLGPINVRYRDIKHVIPFVIQVWMYASPVVYPVSMVPERWKLLYSLNPMVGVIEGFRWALLGKGSPEIVAMAISAAAVIVLLVGGLLYFARMQRFFADVI
jgi:lipopolysaccharide transport system permease protein